MAPHLVVSGEWMVKLSEIRHFIFLKPSRRLAFLYIVGIIASTIVVVGLHYHIGLDYEFHVFIVLPVLAAGWVFGALIGGLISLWTTGLWLWADWILDRHETHEILLVNTTFRLVILLAGVLLIAKLRTLFDQLRTLAFRDPLTKLPNRRAFQEVGQQLLALAWRQGTPVTCIFIDLDRFKEVNDSQGHHTGDHLLMVVAEGLRQRIRASDIAGRLGGDEFAILLPKIARDQAGQYAEELRGHLLDLMIVNKWPVTFSIGVASYAHPPSSFRAMLADADGLMYEVKQTGRNRILMREFLSPNRPEDLSNPEHSHGDN